MENASAEFLDSNQYTHEEIRKYELIYGRDFVSPGGRETAWQFISELELEENDRVLDIGCGLGGSAFLMASECGAIVDAIDLSSNMVALATRRCSELALDAKVRLRQQDCLQLSDIAEYDLVFSRDVFLHIHDKRRLFDVLARVLKPRGRLFFTDYCCGEQPHSEAFSQYVAQRRYCLHTVSEYRGLIEDSGFEEAAAQDLTAEFIRIHERELRGLPNAQLSSADVDELRAGWSTKISRARGGEQRWASFWGHRPS